MSKFAAIFHAFDAGDKKCASIFCAELKIAVENCLVWLAKTAANSGGATDSRERWAYWASIVQCDQVRGVILKYEKANAAAVRNYLCSLIVAVSFIRLFN